MCWLAEECEDARGLLILCVVAPMWTVIESVSHLWQSAICFESLGRCELFGRFTVQRSFLQTTLTGLVSIGTHTVFILL